MGGVVMTIVVIGRIVAMAAGAVVARVPLNDGFWLASLWNGATIYREHCRPASEAGHQNNEKGQLGTCDGPEILKLLNSVSEVPLIRFCSYLLGISQSLRDVFADLKLDPLYRGTI